MIKITVPWPPSVNHYYKPRRGSIGGRVVTREGKAYQNTVKVIALNHRLRMVKGAVRVDRVLYCPDWRMRDEDNILKALYDSITKAGLIEDDSMICQTSSEKWKTEISGYVVLTIAPVDRPHRTTKSGAWFIKGE